MSIYTNRVLPRIMNAAMSSKENAEIRARVCVGLGGNVAEIGFGSGLNVPYYPAAVQTVHAVEPQVRSVALAAERISASHTQVVHANLTGEQVDLEDASMDAVLATWTLCSIPDVDAALREIRRILKPKGVFHFVEHGISPDAKVARNQHRLEPLNKRVFGGCHLTRDIPSLITRAGFTIDEMNTYEHPKDPKPFGWTFEGRARLSG